MPSDSCIEPWATVVELRTDLALLASLLHAHAVLYACCSRSCDRRRVCASNCICLSFAACSCWCSNSNSRSRIARVCTWALLDSHKSRSSASVCRHRVWNCLSMVSCTSVVLWAASADSRHRTSSASLTTLDFQSFASLLSRRICASNSFSWTKCVSRSDLTRSSCASQQASCAWKYWIWSLVGDVSGTLWATVCASCSWRSLPWVALWATIRRHPSSWLIRLLIQLVMLAWKPRMKGDMFLSLGLMCVALRIEQVCLWDEVFWALGPCRSSWFCASWTWRLRAWVSLWGVSAQRAKLGRQSLRCSRFWTPEPWAGEWLYQLSTSHCQRSPTVFYIMWADSTWQSGARQRVLLKRRMQ